MGELYLRRGTNEGIDNKLPEELVEHALKRSGLTYQVQAPQKNWNFSLISSDGDFDDLRETLGYIARNALEKAPQGYECRPTQLCTTEFVRGELPAEQREKSLDHYISACERCHQHLETEVELQKNINQQRIKRY